MLIYNVTINVDEPIAEEWLIWLQTEHIPDLLNTGCFTKYQIVKILSDEPESVTYAVQYYTDSKEQLDVYLEQHADGMRKKGTERWGERFIAFRTIMEVIR